MMIKIYDLYIYLNDEVFYGDVGVFLVWVKYYGVIELNMIGFNWLLNDCVFKLVSIYLGLYVVIGFYFEDLVEVILIDWEGLKKVL